MGSVKKWVNPVTATKTIYKAVTGKNEAPAAVEEAPTTEDSAATTEDSVAKANRAQYMAKQRGDNQADVSGTMAVGLDNQASVPTSLTGLGGVSNDEKKLSRRRALGV